jgi:hypothetical protein
LCFDGQIATFSSSAMPRSNDDDDEEVASFLLQLAGDPAALEALISAELAAPDVRFQDFLHSEGFKRGVRKKFVELLLQAGKGTEEQGTEGNGGNRGSPPSLPVDDLVPALRPLCSEQAVPMKLMAKLVKKFESNVGNGGGGIDAAAFESVFRFFFVVARLEFDGGGMAHGEAHGEEVLDESAAPQPPPPQKKSLFRRFSTTTSSSSSSSSSRSSSFSFSSYISGASKSGGANNPLAGRSPISEGIRKAKAARTMRKTLGEAVKKQNLNALRFWNLIQTKRAAAEAAAAAAAAAGGGKKKNKMMGKSSSASTANVATADDIAR